MKGQIVYLHVTIRFVLVRNKSINMFVKRNLHFYIKSPATSFGFLATYHRTVYEYKQRKLTTARPELLKVEIQNLSYMLFINFFIHCVTKPFKKKKKESCEYRFGMYINQQDAQNSCE